MNIFRRIALSIRLFFTVEIPCFWKGRSQLQKFGLGCLGLVLAQILFFASIFGFVFMMSFLNSNKTYEFLKPDEEIAGIRIIQVNEDVDLYGYPVDNIPGILDQVSTVQVTLEQDRIADCVEELSSLPARKWWNDPSPYIQDGTVLITYRDGSREWICAEGTFYHDKQENDASMTWYYFKNEDFEAFLEKYGYQDP